MGDEHFVLLAPLVEGLEVEDGVAIERRVTGYECRAGEVRGIGGDVERFARSGVDREPRPAGPEPVGARRSAQHAPRPPHPPSSRRVHRECRRGARHTTARLDVAPTRSRRASSRPRPRRRRTHGSAWRSGGIAALEGKQRSRQRGRAPSHKPSHCARGAQVSTSPRVRPAPGRERATARRRRRVADR